MMGWYNGVGWGGWSGMAILMILFWGLVIWGTIALVRSTNASGPKASFEAPTHEATASSDEILALRFARGEIDEEEYTRRTAILGSLHAANVSARSPEAARDDRALA